MAKNVYPVVQMLKQAMKHMVDSGMKNEPHTALFIKKIEERIKVLSEEEKKL